MSTRGVITPFDEEILRLMDELKMETPDVLRIVKEMEVDESAVLASLKRLGRPPRRPRRARRSRQREAPTPTPGQPVAQEGSLDERYLALLASHGFLYPDDISLQLGIP